MAKDKDSVWRSGLANKALWRSYGDAEGASRFGDAEGATRFGDSK